MRDYGNFDKFFGSDDKTSSDGSIEKKTDFLGRCEKQRDISLWADEVIRSSLEAEITSEKRERDMRKGRFLFPFFIGALLSLTALALVYFCVLS